MKRFAFVGLALMFLAACQPQAGPLSEEDLTEIRSLGPAIDQIVLTGEWNQFVGMFAEDGILMPPNDVPFPIRDFMGFMEPIGMSVSEHKIEFVDVDGYGDIAYARGTYAERYTVSGVTDPIEDSGKILSVLRKQPDGSWLFSIWTWSSDLPVMEGENSEAGEQSS
jgi:ketosteroid isomerase-like protein